MHPFLRATLDEQPPNPVSGSTQALAWQFVEPGIVELTPFADATASVVLSAGIHGDETAPIELLDRLLHDLLHGDQALAARLLIVLGNPAAMRLGRRYADDDMNRLFSGRHAKLPESRDARRAAVLEAAVARFFALAPRLPRRHYDLHTAIRPSLIERFGLLPCQNDRPYDADLLAWLDASGIEALIVNRSAGGTFCQHTCDRHGAASCTLELGKVRPFGQNDLTRFAAIDGALRRLIAGAPRPARQGTALRVFDVAEEIVKHGDTFELLLPDDVPNFTPYPRGTPIAREGDAGYAVRNAEERIVFPNSRVKPGLRAGLMVVERPRDSLFRAV